MSLAEDATVILNYLNEPGTGGAANATLLREDTGLTLARVNKALDALRRSGEVVETTQVQNTDGDTLPVWSVTTNRGWAKYWVVRSEWPHPVLPNGREPLPDDVDLPAGFRANWEAP